jgi:hypothetical protein
MESEDSSSSAISPNGPSTDVLPSVVDTTRLLLLVRKHGLVIGLGMFVLFEGGYLATVVGTVC